MKPDFKKQVELLLQITTALNDSSLPNNQKLTCLNVATGILKNDIRILAERMPEVIPASPKAIKYFNRRRNRIGKRNGLGSLGAIGRSARNNIYKNSARRVARFMKRNKFNKSTAATYFGVKTGTISAWLRGTSFPHKKYFFMMRDKTSGIRTA